MLIHSPACSACLFGWLRWYGLLITVDGVGGVSDIGGDFSQTRNMYL